LLSSSNDSRGAHSQPYDTGKGCSRALHSSNQQITSAGLGDGRWREGSVFWYWLPITGRNGGRRGGDEAAAKRRSDGKKATGRRKNCLML